MKSNAKSNGVVLCLVFAVVAGAQRRTSNLTATASTCCSASMSYCAIVRLFAD